MESAQKSTIIIARPTRLDYHNAWVQARKYGVGLLNAKKAMTWSRIETLTETFWLDQEDKEHNTGMIFNPQRGIVEFKPKNEEHLLVFLGSSHSIRKEWDFEIKMRKNSWNGWRFSDIG